MNNRIIQRIAAYYEADNTVNSIIPQNTSTKQFNQSIAHQYALMKLNNIPALHHLKYDPCDIGLCGDNFSIENNQYVIEWQVHGITKQSRLTALDEFNDYCIQERIYFNSPKYKELRAKFDNFIYQYYYWGTLLIFKNDILYKNSQPKYFNADYSKQQLKDEGNRLIEQYKQEL